MKILAVTACPTGIAHTYMAAAACLVLMACVAVAEERKIRRIKRELKAATLATQSV